jgi:hypothetical protein
MQSIQIDGIFTYIDNIKKLKLGDTIKLKPNPKNRLNKNAIGAYTTDFKKIGYIPFNKSQIDINLNYTVTTISLNSFKPLLLISVCFPNENIIIIKPTYLNNNKNDELIELLEHFSKYLINNKIEFELLKIIYNDENFIDLLIDNNIFYTVTKKYYDLNIFKYDEFYKYKLIPTCIYEPFKIHRLEIYIKKKYKKIYINKKFNNSISIDILNCEEIIINKIIFKNNILNNNSDIIINIINEDKNNILISNIKINNDIIYKETDFYKILKEYNDIKYILLYSITNHEYYNNNIINNNNNINYKYCLFLDINNFIKLYSNLKLGGLCYNHKYKLYCDIDLYDDDNIIEIIFNDLTNNLFINLIIKLIIFNKSTIHIYNPLKGIIMKYKLENKEEIINIFNLYY